MSNVTTLENNVNMNANDRLTLRIPADLKRALRACAEKEGRTVANLVIFVMRKYLEGQIRLGR
jgi:uncharacterized protein (DUF1778 family)